MKRFLGIILVALFALGAVGGPAAADPLDDLEFSTVPVLDQIPFNVPLSTGSVYQGIPGTGTDTGFIGVCDVDLQCAGLSTRLYESGGSVAVTPTKVTVSGVVCIRSFRAPCGDWTSPGTGVVITERSYDLPEGVLTRPTIDTNTCAWVFDPRFSGRCTGDILDIAISDELVGPLRVELPGGTESFIGAGMAIAPDRLVIETP